MYNAFDSMQVVKSNKSGYSDLLYDIPRHDRSVRAKQYVDGLAQQRHYNTLQVRLSMCRLKIERVKGSWYARWRVRALQVRYIDTAAGKGGFAGRLYFHRHVPPFSGYW